MFACEQRRGPGFGADADDDGPLGTGRAQHRHRIGNALPIGVLFWILRSVRFSVAGRIVGHDAEMTREIWHLRLPDARMRDRPRRKKQNRLRSVAKNLERDLDSVAFGEAFAVRVSSSHLALRFRIFASRSSSQRSIQSSSSLCPVRMPESVRRNIPSLNVKTSAVTA